MGEWIVPFKGRNRSGPANQNFLWSSGNAYIMDNHRAALWCWLQQIDRTETVDLLHIDQHYDTLYSRIDEWKSALPSLWDMPIDDYLALDYASDFGKSPLIRWDNYLSLFLESYSENVCECVFATHRDGDLPKCKSMRQVEVWDLPGNIEYWLTQGQRRWVVNVDLDYFFCDQEDKRKTMVSDEYIESLFRAIKRRLDAGGIAALTLCLTPDEEYTGGWKQAEQMCKKACSFLGLDFELP